LPIVPYAKRPDPKELVLPHTSFFCLLLRDPSPYTVSSDEGLSSHSSSEALTL